MKNHISLKRIERKKLITEVCSQLPSGKKNTYKSLCSFGDQLAERQAEGKLEDKYSTV